ncbi:acetyl-CoA carboxylase biotin carboxylase subunit [Kistimonas asteriae]|uniref:acetyl-CoA carboxylase biotin carboxylase subunit n=1 Tax=Kistimonas asteriae TaxID=517724 RepID=UPI001BA9B58B|nr:acetyl/propionyl/methylcrotonyl-CoA carboxylase subunit alpha [Kistimonas asteriae]
MSHGIQSITKLLVANRGEIACRIFKTAKRLGLGTVAIYSEPDQQALHVTSADEAYCVGPAPATDSYLNIPAILAAAKQSGADAIHPGYGFLSENAGFAQAVMDAGLQWIGPPPSAIDAMGSKSEAKRLMETAGVPLLPGFHGHDQQDDKLLDAARAIGFPVMLKASAGGGGKGMRVVEQEGGFAEALTGARREALKSFADDTLLLEKYLPSPRHIEVQIFFDNAGSGIYLADRDCSVQRRHQKVVEEAPAPGLTDNVRIAMGTAAVAAGQTIGYTGAGTVEFLLDSDGQFYFMEMNTRLQVEHPVTEMITGQDLVEWQLRVADGQALPLSQNQVSVNGHAVETRLYAEQVAQDFMPATGDIAYLSFPAESDRLRVETGIRTGDQVSPYYDPMLAKLVVWGESRDQAIAGMHAALQGTRIAGISTNRDFLIRVLDNPQFCSVNFSTGLIEQNKASLIGEPQDERLLSLAVAALWRLHQATQQQTISPWLTGQGWRMNLPAISRFRFASNGEMVDIQVTPKGHRHHCQINGEAIDVDGLGYTNDSVMLTGNSHGPFSMVQHSDTLTVVSDSLTLSLSTPDYDVLEEVGSGFNAPMNGTIVSVQVKPGDQVLADAPLLVMEAMKMEHTIRAPRAGEIADVFYNHGDLVEEGVPLLAMTEEPAS